MSENYFIYNDEVVIDNSVDNDVNNSNIVVDNNINTSDDTNVLADQDIWNEIKSDRNEFEKKNNTNKIIGFVIVSLFIILILIVYLLKKKDRPV